MGEPQTSARAAVSKLCIVCFSEMKHASALAENICPRCRRDVDNQTLEAYLTLPADALEELLGEPQGDIHAKTCRRYGCEDLECCCGADDEGSTPELDFGEG
jgi:hypothetical protein